MMKGKFLFPTLLYSTPDLPVAAKATVATVPLVMLYRPLVELSGKTIGVFGGSGAEMRRKPVVKIY